LNGHLYEGSTGTAGELGHLSIVSNGIACNCGHKGCFERYCSASALKQKLPKEISLEQFFLNPSSHIEVYTEFVEHLSNALTSIANTFDPDVILLGGALSNGFKDLLPTVSENLKKRCFSAIAKNIQLDFCKYSTYSGAIGAALIAEL
jgi:glucokinase